MRSDGDFLSIFLDVFLSFHGMPFHTLNISCKANCNHSSVHFSEQTDTRLNRYGKLVKEEEKYNVGKND